MSLSLPNSLLFAAFPQSGRWTKRRSVRRGPSLWTCADSCIQLRPAVSCGVQLRPALPNRVHILHRQIMYTWSLVLISMLAFSPWCAFVRVFQCVQFVKSRLAGDKEQVLIMEACRPYHHKFTSSCITTGLQRSSSIQSFIYPVA